MNESQKQFARSLIIDDHPIVTDALVTSLRALGIFDDIRTASSLELARQILSKDSDFQLVLLDLHLSDAVGTQSMISLRENYPDVPVVIFSGNDEPDIINKAFECGVRGFVPKRSSVSVVINAIKLVLSGNCYIPDSALTLLGLSPSPGQEIVNSSNDITSKLTPRQEQVLHFLLQGMPNKIIASRLEMAEGTVKTHLNSVYRVLGARSRAQAILRAQQLGII